MNPQQDEELLVAQEEIKILRALIDSQNLRNYRLENELLGVVQKLEFVKDLLAKVSLADITFEQAKVIAKLMLQDQEETSELVAKLLGIIYGVTVETEELQQLDTFNFQSSELGNYSPKKAIFKSRKLRSRSQEIRWILCIKK